MLYLLAEGLTNNKVALIGYINTTRSVAPMRGVIEQAVEILYIYK